MNSDEATASSNSSAFIAATMFFCAITGGSLFLYIWQQVEALVFIIWGTGGRNIAAAIEFTVFEPITTIVMYVQHTMPILALGAFTHSILVALLARSSFRVCCSIALFSTIPAVWNLARLVPIGQVAGVPGDFAIFVWTTFEVLKWPCVWVVIWYFTNAVIRYERQH